MLMFITTSKLLQCVNFKEVAYDVDDDKLSGKLYPHEYVYIRVCTWIIKIKSSPPNMKWQERSRI